MRYRIGIKRERGKNIYEDDGINCRILIYGINNVFRGEVVIDSCAVERCKTVKWFIRFRKGKPTSVAGHTENRRNERMHHYLFGEPPDGFEYDHCNRNALDNKKENVRLCTLTQNQWNRGLTKANHSGVKGVYKPSNWDKWVARITVNCKNISLGRFTKKEEAVMAYNNAVFKYRDREFAYFNQLRRMT